MSEVTVGNYRIVREIAEGGFGTTYEAVHAIGGGKSCIKHCGKLSREYNDLLVKEAMALWDLAHFSLPAMRDIIEMDDGSLALVMSYIDAMTVEQAVKKVGRLPDWAVAWIVDRALNALLYLHHYGVVHGDVKPQNVMMQHLRQHVYLIDFGLANAKPSAGSRVDGFTEHFSSPEQVASVEVRRRGGGFTRKGPSVAFRTSKRHAEPIATLLTRTDDLVHVTKFDEDLDAFDLLARSREIFIDASPVRDFGGVVFPFTDLDVQPDAKWLIGMRTTTATHGDAEMVQAVQQFKLQMNHKGVVVQDAFAGAAVLECMMMTKPDLCIDGSFLFVLERPGMSQPVCAAVVRPDSFKDPGDLAF